MARLTPTQREELVRRLKAGKESHAALAQAFGVKPPTISGYARRLGLVQNGNGHSNGSRKLTPEEEDRKRRNLELAALLRKWETEHTVEEDNAAWEFLNSCLEHPWPYE